MVDTEFDIKVGGDDTGVVGKAQLGVPGLTEYLFIISPTFLIAFPRSPTGIIKRYIADEADTRLARYTVIPEAEVAQTQLAEPGTHPDPSQVQPQSASQKLPNDAVDAPLMRLYNFMRKWLSCYRCVC